MRLWSGFIVLAAAVVPGVAHASAWGSAARVSFAVSGQEPTAEEPDTPQPTSSKAPASASDIPDAPPADDDDAADPVAPREETTLAQERGAAQSGRMGAKDDPFHRHGIGVRSGITIIPTWILSKWLETHTNALCRGDKVGDFAAERGNLKTDGCNFYVGAEYTYRFSRIFDITSSMGYQRVYAPEGFWLDNGQFDANDPTSLGGADYTEVDLHMMYMEVDFIARAPIVVTRDFEFGIGGGGGIGLGVLFGGVYQTPLGARPWGFDAESGDVDFGSCQSISDLADFTRCTPRWDAGEDGDKRPPAESDLETPNPNLFATCTGDACSHRDLRAFGYRQKQSSVPPVIPVVNLILSARFIIKDAFGISINGGFNTGFYFGGSLMYFFGPSKQDDMGVGPAGAKARHPRRRALAQR